MKRIVNEKRKLVFYVKKTSKIILSLTVLFLSLNSTFAYFQFNTTLTNKFNAKNYNIKLDGSGGTYNTNAIIVKNGETTLPIPTKNGYTFLGYSSTENGNVDISNNVKNIDVINNKMIYAKYKAKSYSITYNTNGGTINNQKTNYTIEENYSLPTPTKTGYTFSGWTGSNGNTPQKSVTIPKGSTGDKSYSANWNVKSYTTKFETNKGGTITNTSDLINFGGTKNITVTPNNGYYLSSFSCTNGYTTNAQVGSDKTSTQTITISNNNKDLASTCTATFTPVTYTISYNVNGGNAINNITYTVESPTFTLPTPTRRVHNFTGWTGSNGNTPQTSVTIPQGSTGNKSFTANWSKFDAAITGVTIVSLRKGESWGGNANGYYSFGTSNQNAGNWTVSVSNHSVHIKGTTKVVSADRYYTFYVYAGNGTSGELLASGTDYPVANRGSGTYAEITLSW